MTCHMLPLDFHQPQCRSVMVKKKQFRRSLLLMMQLMMRNLKFIRVNFSRFSSLVLSQNDQKCLTFDIDFLPELFSVIEGEENEGRFLVLQREVDGRIFLWHPDYVRVFRGPFPQQYRYIDQQNIEEYYHIL